LVDPHHPGDNLASDSEQQHLDREVSNPLVISTFTEQVVISCVCSFAHSFILTCIGGITQKIAGIFFNNRCVLGCNVKKLSSSFQYLQDVDVVVTDLATK